MAKRSDRIEWSVTHADDGTIRLIRLRVSKLVTDAEGNEARQDVPLIVVPGTEIDPGDAAQIEAAGAIVERIARDRGDLP